MQFWLLATLQSISVYHYVIMVSSSSSSSRLAILAATGTRPCGCRRAQKPDKRTCVIHTQQVYHTLFDSSSSSSSYLAAPGAQPYGVEPAKLPQARLHIQTE
jgi:hypothetical protein